MGAQTTSSTTDGHAPTRAGRGRGVILAALTAALFSLSAGAAAASPVETPPSPQHLDVACSEVAAVTPSLPTVGAPLDQACQNVNGWQ